MKTIAIDIDDTLNDFTETLRTSTFEYDESFALSREVFDGYLERVRANRVDREELLATELSFFRAKIHLECYQRAKPRADAIEFVRWLKREGFRVIICTRRDLRRSYTHTRKWLDGHEIPFDHIFMAGNKIVFCRLWGISILIDDDPFNVTYGKKYGVDVYYPIHEKHRDVPTEGARGFTTFEEVKAWIAK